MPKGYWIVRVDVKNEEPVKRYVAGNHPIFEKFGGRYLVRAQKFAVPEGSSRSLNVVIEFPDYASALACYHSPEYQTNKKTIIDGGQVVGRLRDSVPGPVVQSLPRRNWFPA